MAIDPYATCPCGSGKKIKFCCSHLLGELNQLAEMTSGGQHQAALAFIETVEQKMPPQACLMAIKLQLLRALRREDEAKKTAAAFLELAPDNPVALAEAAIQEVVDGNVPAAVARLQQALAASATQLYSRVYEAMGILARTLLEAGQIRAGRALLQLQATAAENDPAPAEMINRLNQSTVIPLLVKDDPLLAESPDDATWKQTFDEAITEVPRGLWAPAAAKLAALAERVDDSPAIWKSLALLRCWLADQPGAAQALQKLASLDIPLEDAVEAEALAMLFSEDPLGDRDDSLWLSFPISETDELAAILTTWPQAVSMPVDATSVAEDDAPPKATFWLLDRPTPETADDLTLETVPCILGQAMLFGRQTDREARLEVVGVAAKNQSTVRAMLVEIAGGRLTDQPEQEALARGSASREILQRPWRLPPGVTRQQFDTLSREHLDRALLEIWPQMPLGLLDGKTLAEAAADPARRVTVLAAILVMEVWTEQAGDRFDFNRLRAKLGLPTLDPFSLGEQSVWSVPLTRLARVKVDELSKDAVREGFFRASMFAARDALRVFGPAVLEQQDLDPRARLGALSLLARVEEDSDLALEYIDQGRREAEAAGESSVQWDLFELTARIARNESPEASQLLKHIQDEHIREPGVAEALRDILIQAGVLAPNGAPGMNVPPPEAAPAAADSGGLWVPGGDQPGGEKSKLWTPDMD